MGNSIDNKRVLVTGGMGYLGSFLVESLRQRGADVYDISIEAEHDEKHFPTNICNFDELDAVVQKIQPDICYHLAASINRDRDFVIFDNMLEVNVKGTSNLLKALEKTMCKQFIFTSTSEIYGNNESPFHEGQLPMPVSPYSLTKVMAENLIRTFGKQYNLDYTIVRLFNFFGENMSEGFFITQMVNTLKRGEDFLMTKGEQTRDFLYVKDVVLALTLVADNPLALNDTFNVCSGKGSSIASLAQYVNKKIEGNSKVNLGAIPYRENEVWEMIGSAKKIKEKLGFTAQYSIEDGLEKLIKEL